MENNFAADAVCLEDWEADIQAYIALMEEGSLNAVETAAVRLLIERASQKIAALGGRCS